MSLPSPSVEFAHGEASNLSVKQIRGIISNPIYVGVGPYPAIMSDEEWIATAKQEIDDVGVEQFLVNMLYVLRESMLMRVQATVDKGTSGMVRNIYKK